MVAIELHFLSNPGLPMAAHASSAGADAVFGGGSASLHGRFDRQHGQAWQVPLSNLGKPGKVAMVLTHDHGFHGCATIGPILFLF